MAQGESRKTKPKATEEAFDDVFKALPKKKKRNTWGTPTTSSFSWPLEARVPEREMTLYRADSR